MKELDRPSPVPALSELANAYKAVESHNAQFTGFGGVFKSILNAVSKAPTEPADGDGMVELPDIYAAARGAMQESIVEGEMNADITSLFHGATFESAGLALKRSGAGVHSDQEAVTSEAIDVSIANTSLFVEFLQSVTPEAVEDLKQSKVLVNVAYNLNAKVDALFGDEQQEFNETERAVIAEAGEDTLRTLAAIESEYERLGLTAANYRQKAESTSSELKDFLDSRQGGVVPEEVAGEYSDHQEFIRRANILAQTENYIHYWGEGVIKEFIKAKGGQLITPPELQGFGPASWHVDGGGYPGWKAAIDFVNQLNTEDRTKGFGEEIRSNLLASVAAALNEVDSRDPAQDYYMVGNRDDLVNVRNALEGKPYEEARLAGYVPLSGHRKW